MINRGEKDEPTAYTRQRILYPKSPLYSVHETLTKTQHVRKVLVQGLLPFSEDIPRIPRPGNMDGLAGAQD